MRIQIDKKPFAATKYYAGAYSTKKEYTFTIVIQDYGDTNVIYVQDITWDDKRPKNYRQVQKQIEDFWKTLD